MEIKEIKEKNQPIILRDGVAPQCAVNGLEKLTKESKPTTGGRAYIPNSWTPQDWFHSHSIANYKWIFTVIGNEKKAGYVKPRK